VGCMADDEEFVIDLSQETPVPQTTATEQTLVPQTTVTVKYFRQEYGTWKKLQNVLERKRTKDLEWQDKRLTTLKGLSGKQLDLLDADQGAYRFLERAVLQVRGSEKGSDERRLEQSNERQLDRSDSKSIKLPSYITNDLPLVSSLLASPILPPPLAIPFAHCRQ